jgi:hypothetical protein
MRALLLCKATMGPIRTGLQVTARARHHSDGQQSVHEQFRKHAANKFVWPDGLRPLELIRQVHAVRPCPFCWDRGVLKIKPIVALNCVLPRELGTHSTLVNNLVRWSANTKKCHVQVLLQHGKVVKVPFLRRIRAWRQ